ncbi:MAG TPA: hypothetical protein VFP70_09270 [Burkholderiales bacterium]|nr:hypothetical protein [Burkholderiales bacterium]
MLAMLTVVGAMYAVVVTLMLLIAEPRNQMPRWLRENLVRIFAILRPRR